jgi:hypothetical protein
VTVQFETEKGTPLKSARYQGMEGGFPALPGMPSPIDIDRLLFDINSTFNPLSRDCQINFHVSGVRDGYVCLSVALPEGMTRAFVSILESMQGLVRCIDIKSRAAAAQGKVIDQAEKERRERFQADFRVDVCTLFDDYISRGHDRKEAVKLTNKAMKVKFHPWANHETVSSVLRAAGRFRKAR